MIDDTGSVYYQHSGHLPLASRISYYVRQQMYDRFVEVVQPTTTTKILDIGVTSDEQSQESNFFEKLYPYKSQITAVGTEDGTYLEIKYPGVRFVSIAGGDPLPFGDKAFDVAFSNAVIEHVGSAAAQRDFVREACRVAHKVFLTTPNRWFPIEHHTGLPLLHYLPKKVYRRLLRETTYTYWSWEENLNAMTKADLKKCVQPYGDFVVEHVGILGSNLIAHTR